jgi:hypothetical protein
MLPRNDIVQIELIEQAPLIPILSPHHPESPTDPGQREAVFVASVEPFFDSIRQLQTFWAAGPRAAGIPYEAT